jgi:hypothetical protein
MVAISSLGLAAAYSACSLINPVRSGRSVSSVAVSPNLWSPWRSRWDVISNTAAAFCGTYAGGRKARR